MNQPTFSMPLTFGVCRGFFALILIVFSTQQLIAQKPLKVKWKNVHVLVYTKNGKGYVHDNVPFAAKAIQKLGEQHGFRVDVTDDPSVFSEAKLKKYNFLIFPSTNNDVFDTEEQRVNFRRYIQAGGGFVGLHSVTGTERNWTWFKMMVGGSFVWHARYQPFTLRAIDADHPSMNGVPKVWRRDDECYFTKEMYPGIRVLMAHEVSSLTGDEAHMEKVRTHSAQFPVYYPAVWYQHFDGGTIWVTTLGHHKNDYEDPVYLNHIFQGMTFVARHSQKLDFSKAYATERDTPLP